jgi:hypothetical protein
MSTNSGKFPIDRETKIMLLKALSKGYFEEADFEFLAQKYENDGIRFDNEELHGSVPISEWLRRFSKQKETA